MKTSYIKYVKIDPDLNVVVRSSSSTMMIFDVGGSSSDELGRNVLLRQDAED